QDFRSEKVPERRRQKLIVVFRPQQHAEAARPTEDLPPLLQIEIEDGTGRDAVRKRQRDDAAARSPDDQIEVLTGPSSAELLEGRKKRRGKQAADSAPVQSQDSEGRFAVMI